MDVEKILDMLAQGVSTFTLRELKHYCELEEFRLRDRIAEHDQYGEMEKADLKERELYRCMQIMARLEAELREREARETSEGEDGAPLH